MDQMLDGNSAAELEYNGVNWRDSEHREAIRQLRRDRQEFIDTLLKNDPATTLYKRGCEFTLRDAISDAFGSSEEFCNYILDDGSTALTTFCWDSDNDEFNIIKMFMQCKLPNEYIRLIGEHAELIANEIFVGWDDE